MKMEDSADSSGLSCEDVSVTFGSIRAVDQVTVAWRAGAIHAIVGQNGAGKTTLARTFAGLIGSHSGTVSIRGNTLASASVQGAKDLGLAMVHQHFTLPPSFTVAEALEATAVGGRFEAFRKQSIDRHWALHLRSLQIDVDPTSRVREVPLETRQLLEIARAMDGDVRILILDEPTAVLAPAAVDRLFGRLRTLRDQGVTIVIVLHKLAEVFSIADTISVMRDGRLVVGPTEASTIKRREVSDAVIGPGVAGTGQSEVRLAAPNPDVRRLELRQVGSTSSGKEPPIVDLTLEVAEREIVGVAGVEGNGQRRLARLIAGLEPVESGEILIDGIDATSSSPSGRRRAGLRIVPFDRNSEGVSQASTLWENYSISGVLGANRARISRGRLRRETEAAFAEWNVRYESVDQLAGELSGGNIQRLILARELAAGLRVLVAAHPTRGLDFLATDFVRSSLRRWADEGAGVLLISSDLEELFGMSDRVVVMRGGRLINSFTPPYDRSKIGDAMLGGLTE